MDDKQNTLVSYQPLFHIQHIQQLEAAIKSEEEALLIKKMLLKQAQKADKEKAKKDTPFPATRAGKLIFGAAELTTRWTCGVNQAMFEALTNPEGWRKNRLEKQAQKLLDKCEAIPDNKHKKAQLMACKIAVFLSKNEEYLDEDTVDFLKENKERLRSEHSKFIKNRMTERAKEIPNVEHSLEFSNLEFCWSGSDLEQAAEEDQKISSEA